MKIYCISDTSKNNIIKEMRICNVSQQGINIMRNKGIFNILKITDIDNRGLNILKQEALSVGAEVALSKDIGNFVKGKSSGLLFATNHQINLLIKKLKTQPFQLKKLSFMLEKLFKEEKSNYKFKINNKNFDFKNKKYVMGILNVTPDSFYDGNKYKTQEDIKKQIQKMIKEKVDIIDIGAESTRPGAKKISDMEEIKRLLPALEITKKLTNIPISIDTYKAKVADIMLKNGANMINDISGLQFDKNMAGVVAKHDAPVVLMHIQGTPQTMQINPTYKNLIQDIIEYLKKSISIADKFNINKIIIDPGIGFGKTVLQNYEILDKIKEFSILKRPILIGLSRKSLIGKVLNNDVNDRLRATEALNLVALLNGASIIRVHDIKEGKETIKLAEQFEKYKKENRK